MHLKLLPHLPGTNELILAWNVWDEIITFEVCEWKNNFIPHLIVDVITYPCGG